MRYFTNTLICCLLCLLIGCNAMDTEEIVVARIGNVKLTKAELDFAVAGGATDADRRTRIYRSLINSKIWGEAGKLMVPSAAPMVRSDVEAYRKRDLTQVYMEQFLLRNLGHTEDQMRSWFNSHKSEFVRNGVTPDFSNWRDSVAIRMTLEENAVGIKEYFEANKIRFRQADSAQVGLLKSKDSLKLVSAIGQIRSGAQFDSVAKRINRDSSLVAKNGKLGMIANGVLVKELYPVPNAAILLFNRTMRLQEGRISDVIGAMDTISGKSTRMYYALIPFQYKDAPDPDYASNKKIVDSLFIQKYQKEILEKNSEMLTKKYKVEYLPIGDVDLNAEYQRRKDDLMTESAYLVLHIEGSDSLKLARLADRISSEKEFRSQALSASQNIQTKPKSGELGWIKPNHCLPSGVGMVPGLGAELQGKTSGYKSSLFFAPDIKKWQVFWVLDVLPSQVKPYDRAKVALQRQLENLGDLPLDSNIALIKIDGRNAIFEKDVLRLKREIPNSQKKNFNRAKLLQMMVMWELRSREAVASGFEKDKVFNILRGIREAESWYYVYKDSILNRYLKYTRDDLKRAYDASPAGLYSEKSFDQATLQVGEWLELPDYVYQTEYALNPEKYSGKKDWLSAKPDIFKQIHARELRGVMERLSYMVYQKLKIQVVDTSYSSYFLFEPKDIMRKGLAEYEARSLVSARIQFQRVRDLVGLDTLAFRATMITAQTYTEEDNFENALQEYKTVYLLWPNHPESYKALFMIGFIQAENLGLDSLASNSFKELIAKFPKCDLADDADWMLKNIQSGGKLAPALLESLGGEAPVSQ